jgi:IclR family acetate operon transcriptional repressor
MGQIRQEGSQEPQTETTGQLSGDVVVEDAPDPRTATPEQGRTYYSRSVERTIKILNLLQDALSGLTVPQISSALHIPAPTAFRYVWTLDRFEYLERDDDYRYRLGRAFIRLHSRQLQALQMRARPLLERLRDETGETATFGVLSGADVICVEAVPSRRRVRMSTDPGTREPLHGTALGKAIASELPEAEVRDLLTVKPLAQMTSNTITDLDEFLDELTVVRRRGYSIDDRESDADGRCVAVPLIGTSLPAALSVSAPADRFQLNDMRRVANVLKVAARQLAHPSSADQVEEEAKEGAASD